MRAGSESAREGLGHHDRWWYAESTLLVRVIVRGIDGGLDDGGLDKGLFFEIEDTAETKISAGETKIGAGHRWNRPFRVRAWQKSAVLKTAGPSLAPGE